MRKIVLCLSAVALFSCAKSAPPAEETATAVTEPATEVEPVAEATAEPTRTAGEVDMTVFASATTIKVLRGDKEELIEDATKIAELVKAMGEGPTTVEVPKCLPQVRLQFMKEAEELGTVSFCDATLASDIVRVDVGDKYGALTVKDAAPLKGVLATAP